jgi:polysaccharide pyruvyl transferase WcaK-like protein
MFYHSGSRNRGCEAIVRSAVSIIRKNVANVTIDLASLDPESDRIIPGVDRIIDVTKTPIKKFSLNNLISILNVKLAKSDNFAHRKQNSRLMAQIPNHDVFLSIGGDNYCYGEQPWLYEVDRSIKRAGKKLVLWGASIGSEDLSAAKIKDLQTFDLVLVRESLTYNILEESGIPKVELCADGAFTMEKEELELPEGWQEGNTIGFNFSPLVWNKNKASKDASRALIRHILDTTDMTIALTPHVMIPKNDDYEMLADFYKEFRDSGRAILLPNDLNAIQYKGYIARMRFFIGARTHATIAAYSNAVPTMVLGYSVKSKGIAKDIFGYERLVLDIQEISDAAKLISKFEELKKDELELKDVLQKKMPYIKEMSDKAGQILSNL